jgi:peptidoglycan/LPS O-acetylase OafA/YrhL
VPTAVTNRMAQFRGPLDSALVRCIAIFLVTNSHLDGLYPIPQLATGGALGNALFFAASGYGLTVGFNAMPKSFVIWYWRRLARLYPSVFLVIGVFELAIPGNWFRWTFGDYMETFIWPTPAWFISAILIFYAASYPFMLLRRRAFYWGGMAALCGLYAYFYLTRVDLTRYSIEGPGNFNWIFYFGLVLLGSYLAAANSISGPGRRRDLFMAVGLLAAYFGFGFLLSKGHFTAYQFLMHLITVLLVIAVFRLSQTEWLIHSVASSKIGKSAVLLISGMTLEIYLLQFYVYSSPHVTLLPFPANVLVFWLVLVFLAWLTAWAASLASNLLVGKT